MDLSMRFVQTTGGAVSVIFSQFTGICTRGGGTMGALRNPSRVVVISTPPFQAVWFHGVLFQDIWG